MRVKKIYYLLQVLLAQNEDGWPENVNRFYVVVAEIIDETGNRIEKFASLSYSGLLPGYSMGCNASGTAHCINTLVAKNRFPQGSRKGP
jgi:hypothetical protein